MSKYNLTDILEQYKIGSGWTTDFDYDGMLKAGLKTGVDTDIEVLKKMSDDFEDVNYHRENNHLQNAIEALEDGAIKEASMFFGDFHAEIKNTIKEQGMDIEPTLGKFMDAKMEEGEAVDLAIEASQEKAGIKEGEGPKEEDQRYIDYLRRSGRDEYADKLVALNPTTLKEARIDRDVAERIEGLLDRSMKAKFIDAFMDIYSDLLEEDNFFPEDIINHLNNEMHAELAGYQRQGDRLAGVGEVMGIDRKGNKQPDTDGSDASKFKRAAMNKESLQETIDDAKTKIDEGSYPFDQCLSDNEGKYGKKGAAKVCGYIKAQYGEGIVKEGVGKKIQQALEDDAKGTESEIKMYMDSLRKSGDSFDDIDDYVEDFKNYIADKSLQEHFKRFM